MKVWIVRLVAVAALVALLLSPLWAQGGVRTERVSIDLDVRPADEAGKFVMTARVKDLSTNLVLAAPHIVFNLGDEAYSTSRLPTGEEIRLRVWVPATRDQTEFTAELVRRGDVAVSTSAKVRLGG
jgi:hypothetical protein